MVQNIRNIDVGDNKWGVTAPPPNCAPCTRAVCPGVREKNISVFYFLPSFLVDK